MQHMSFYLFAAPGTSGASATTTSAAGRTCSTAGRKSSSATEKEGDSYPGPSYPQGGDCGKPNCSDERNCSANSHGI